MQLLSMKQGDYEKLRAAFLKAFVSVPSSLRDQIIVVIGGEPYNWNSVLVEVKANTEKAKMMLQQIKKLELID